MRLLWSALRLLQPSRPLPGRLTALKLVSSRGQVRPSERPWSDEPCTTPGPTWDPLPATLSLVAVGGGPSSVWSCSDSQLNVEPTLCRHESRHYVRGMRREAAGRGAGELGEAGEHGGGVGTLEIAGAGKGAQLTGGLR